MLSLCLAGSAAAAPANAPQSSLQSTLDQLRAQLAALQSQIDSFSTGASSEAPLTSTRSKGRAGRDDRPGVLRKLPQLALDPCLGVKPCLHTTVEERLARGCAGAPVFSGNWTSPVPVPGRDSLGQRFLPRLDCDVAEVWKLSKVEARRGRLTDAMEAHALSRLAGLRNKLWLIVGTSVDHTITRSGCDSFGVPRESVVVSTAELARALPAGGQHAFAGGSGLAMDGCAVPLLNLTVVETHSAGMASLRPSNDAALQPARLRGWELALAAMRLHHRPPDFVTLSGEEWDFKNWARAGRQPNSSLAWREVGEVIRMQVEAIRSHWPRAVVMVRTMYGATYGGFGGDYGAYNALLREVSTRRLSRRAARAAGGVAGQQPEALARRAERERAAGIVETECGRLAHESDVASMAHCSACSSRSGWTKDGMHPHEWFTASWIEIVLNQMADLGAACQDLGAV